jgi:hypothetical protein
MHRAALSLSLGTYATPKCWVRSVWPLWLAYQLIHLIGWIILWQVWAASCVCMWTNWGCECKQLTK